MIDKETTIILPCAGEGNRLGLKTPKELFEIFPGNSGAGTKLIDFSLKHISAFPYKEKITVAVVIRPWKTGVAEYVARQLPGITVKTVMFNENYNEWPGSVYSAKNFFSKNNLVLLPDSYLGLCADSRKTLVELVLDSLALYKVVFGCLKCTGKDVEILRTLGAVTVEDGIVTAFQDKPVESLHRFNGFWGCYGFRKEYGESLYHFLIGSVQHRSLPLTEQPFYPPGAIRLGAYYDLGTWENIDRFKGVIQKFL